MPIPTRRKQVTYSQRPNHAARAVHAKGERQFRTYDTSYIRPKRSKAPAIFAAVIALLLLLGIGWVVVSTFTSCSSISDTSLLAEGQEATVVVAEGSGASVIAGQLVDAGLIQTKAEFVNRVNELGVADQLKPGTYVFVGGTALDDIITELQNGSASVTSLTIPEGYRLTEIAAAAEAVSEGRITADAFIAAASDASVYAAEYPFLADAGNASLEGFLFPKTYEITRDTTADSLVRAMLAQFQIETAGLDWSYPQSQGLSVYQAVTLASIVEKEASGDPVIRARVAAVFYNRLSNTGWPSYGFLQSDATTAYEVRHDPTADEVHANTPYSTYSNKGLPPTPICSPSLACLQAVCAPSEESLGTDYFFYFDSAGNYSFSREYDEHMASFS